MLIIIMERITKYRSIIFILAMLAFGTPARTQVPVERSKDKVVISGVTYYLHIVKKGETVYSISKAYGITTEELIRENPPALNGLREGQSLRIPYIIVTTTPPAQSAMVSKTARDESRFIYHRLQPGETIYFLSRKYSVSEHDVIQANPGIDINKLPLGSEIAIPRKQLMNEKETFADQQAKGYYHKVLKGETMYSIARLYGVTVRELRRENRDMRFPQVGDYLSIPGMEAAREREEAEVAVAADTVPLIPEGQVVYYDKPLEYTPVRNLSGSFNIAVLLPFYLPENSRRYEIDSSRTVKGKKIYQELRRSDDWIYPRSLGFVEMYEGILLAADTLRSLGLDINIHAFDVKSDTLEVLRLIRSGRLDNMDLIIGPVHSVNLGIVASYAGSRGIPVVSPVQLSSNTVLSNNPTLFMANSTLEVAQNAIARKISDYYNNNIVLIHSSTGDSDIMRFRSMILNELSYKMPLEEIRLRDMVFYSRSVFGNDSINRLAHALSDRNDNIIVIASEDAPVMSESITDIHALSRKFTLKVFGYPGMRYLDNLDHKICFDLGLMIYSPYWIDYKRQDVIQFNSDFRSRFLTQPSEMSYAWQGYDIVYYFLSGLAIHGKEFISHPEIHNPDLLHTEFDFRRKESNNGFENQKLFLVRYSNNYELELVEEEETSTLK